MILHELFNKFSWEDIKVNFIDIYESRYVDFEVKLFKKNIKHYEKAYNECKSIKPFVNKGVIHASTLIVDGIMGEEMEVYFTNGKKNKNDVSAKSYYGYLSSNKRKEFLNAEIKYALDFVSRTKALGMTIDLGDMEKLTEEKFLSYCFFFMTMFGVSKRSHDSGRRKTLLRLRRSIDDVKEGKARCFTIEEVMSNIKNHLSKG